MKTISKKRLFQLENSIDFISTYIQDSDEPIQITNEDGSENKYLTFLLEKMSKINIKRNNILKEMGL
jgi:hypothetical protein